MFRSKRTTVTFFAVAVAITLILITVVIAGSSVKQAPQNSGTAQSSNSTPPQSQTSSMSTSVHSFSPTKTITVGTQTGANTIATYPLYPCNCSVYPLPGRSFPTLHDLVHNSIIWLANVTSSTTISVRGVPFTTYNITNIETLYSDGIANYNATGNVAEMAWVGGTVDGTTMNAVGYPTLKVGGLYVFFVGPYSFDPGASAYPIGPPPFGNYWLEFDGGLAHATTGGAQGLFYVQDGKVFSLDNMFPQDDAWLPVKVNGMPLAQFISELQSA